MIPNVKQFGRTLNASLSTKDTTTNKIYGCDTETYREERGKGLKSIQIFGENEEHYFTTKNWEQ